MITNKIKTENLFHEFCQDDGVLFWRDIVTNPDKTINNGNCFIFSYKLLFNCHKDYASSSYNIDVKCPGSFYSISIIKYNAIFSFSRKVDCSVFSSTEAKVNALLGVNNLNPTFVESITYTMITPFSNYQDFFFYGRGDKNEGVDFLNQIKLIYSTKAYYGCCIRYQLLPSKILRSLSRSSLLYPVQSMLFSLVKSNISHNEISQDSAALPMEILCCLSFSNASCIFQESIALTSNLLIVSDLSACQFFSIIDNSFCKDLSNLTETVFAIFVFNILQCKRVFKPFVENASINDFGAILGKSLETCEEEKCIVNVLVSLS